ncbi:hypothetical protein CERZMDRAFT_89435 [Cercospora zeae-maydis SCOH1-5]|uniref:Uncharacterized protein n=1 Tax=Cercospora zeae-maydis SCOH1-5 TaxID=717836 RepID=A0A6A6EYS7_9PEZI|nr:hypothetical protein CERZMDRAFT_89435 [Cercospora zeae-maydis SCOH1-5]
MLSRIALFAAAFEAAFVLAQDAQPCISKPDHSNYGKNGDSWCRWDSINFWKPQGVGCKTDAECQSVRYPYSNCHDSYSIGADSLLATGVMFCDYLTKDSPQTSCLIGVRPNPNRVGLQGSSSDSSSVDRTMEYCRDLLSKLGFPDINVIAGCPPPGGVDYTGLQCIYQCNSGPSCGEGQDPKAYHKTLPDAEGCPGYENATAY